MISAGSKLLRDTSGATALPDVSLRGSWPAFPLLTQGSILSSVSGGGLIVLLDPAQLLLADPSRSMRAAMHGAQTGAQSVQRAKGVTSIDTRWGGFRYLNVQRPAIVPQRTRRAFSLSPSRNHAHNTAWAARRHAMSSLC